jgi:hypothetical protein
MLIFYKLIECFYISFNMLKIYFIKDINEDEIS